MYRYKIKNLKNHIYIIVIFVIKYSLSYKNISRGHIILIKCNF